MSKRRWAKVLCVVFLACFVGLQVTAEAADLTADYTWDFVKIGGFTWFTNIYVHPGGNGPVYNDSDTATPWRWDAANAEWVPVATAYTLPERPEGGYYGDRCCGTSYSAALSIVGAPGNANVAYMAWQDKLAAGDTGNVYRSSDQGDTWTLPGQLDVFLAPNSHDDARTAGPRLAVDPADENVVYFGSQRDGLFVTYDGCQNWTQITDIPVPSNEGTTVVRIDPNSGTTDGLTNVIYACVAGNGTYQSTDAGASWTSIGGSQSVRHAEVGGDGVFYTADYNSALKKYSGGSWTDISPGSIYDVSVDPFDANRLVAVNEIDEVYLSTDQGASWTQLSYTRDNNGIAAQAQRDHSLHPINRHAVVFDTGTQDLLWTAEAYGLWQLDISGGTAAWKSISHGTEGYCTHTITKPPGGGVISGAMDGGVYYHPDPGKYSSVQVCSPDTDAWLYQHGWGSGYCIAQPSFVAAINSPPHTYSEELSGYSTDYGKQGTWTTFASAPGHNAESPTGLDVSATNPDCIAVFDGSQGSAYFSTDRGGSWSKKSFGGRPITNWWGPGEGAICADEVDGGTYYVYNWNDGGVWRTTNNGGDWGQVGELPGGVYQDMCATPDNAGHVWWCGGIVGGDTTYGLYRSTDYGATWTHVSGTDYALSVGMGKPESADSYPTIYYYGKVDGVEGVWRSTDEAQTWDLIANVAPLGIFADSLACDGDQEIFGRVYFNTTGTGSAWGDCGGGTGEGNSAPVANDDEYSTEKNTTLSVAAPGVLENDEDADGDELTAILVSDVSYGSLTLNSDGSFDYTPNTDFIGDDSFDYKANDGTEDSNVATCVIHVTGTGTKMHVEDVNAYIGKTSMGCEFPYADVLILDENGDPVPDATVTGTFTKPSGTFSAVTGQDGWCTVKHESCQHNSTGEFCVDDVTHDSLTYDSSANVETCDTY